MISVGAPEFQSRPRAFGEQQALMMKMVSRFPVVLSANLSNKMSLGVPPYSHADVGQVL
jgi:hypothetical protein